MWWIFCTHVLTCSDGIKNGNETGIDCGGSAHLVQLVPTELKTDQKQEWTAVVPAPCSTCSDGIKMAMRQMLIVVVHVPHVEPV
ncbi:MAG: hypothetical protein IPO98_09280 [Saprospiraceae bacterium]|nr:hypothetical protein [Saprospiraceae bacterium]